MSGKYKIFELSATTQNSYYKKAHVITTETGNIFLKSYNTIVCGIDTAGNFKRTWPGYSFTTMKHINDFLRLYNIPGGGKKWWMSLPVYDS